MKIPFIGAEWRKLPDTASPNVVIVNIDLSGSSLVERAFPNEWHLLDKVNKLQDEILQVFSGPEWLLGDWSGDGLVALFLDNVANPDPPVGTALGIPQIVQRWRESCQAGLTEEPEGAARGKALDDVDVRIGVCRGEIRWRRTASASTGRIISPVMNKAGHLQKECSPGTVMIDDNTKRSLTVYVASFPEGTARTVIHGATTLKAYPYVATAPQNRGFPPIVQRIVEDSLAECNTITKAPGACYFFGEFAVMFGHVALIQPLPRYIFVGVARTASDAATTVTLERGLAVKPEAELVLKQHLNDLVIPDDFDDVPWKPEVSEAITRIVAAEVGPNAGHFAVSTVSLIPNKCGLNASSALSMALAAALLPDAGKAISQGKAVPVDKPVHIESGDSLSRLVKFGWALDNVFHLDAGSGCGVAAALLGSHDGWPLIYFAEGRSFQGPYPIVFNGAIRPEDGCSLLSRIRAVALRTTPVGRKPGSLNHEYAVFHTQRRPEEEGTGNIIKKFLSAREVAGDVAVFIKNCLKEINPQGHKFYLSTNLLARALRLEGYGKLESFEGDPEPIPRLKEMLVESFANALGACSIAGTSAFVQEYFQHAEWAVFAKCMNAYQELMCACGVSTPFADLFNYRSDAFSHTFGNLRRPFGSKLSGAGRGGDFLVVAPAKDLSTKFETFRHEVKIGRNRLPCHFASWEPSEECTGVMIVKGGV